MIGKAVKFTSIKPAHLGKVFTLKDGALHKEVAGSMAGGEFVTVTFKSAADLAALLASVTTAQALSASVPVGAGAGRVVTEKALPSNPGAVARTKRFFALPAQQHGFLLLDADAPNGSEGLSEGALFALLVELVPAAAAAGVVAWASGSSQIWVGDTCHRGSGGLHLYLMIQDISDTQRFGQVLSKRLWLAGHGRIEVSASGALLSRTVFDESVHQPARLVFSGGAVCTPPLEQRRGPPVLLADGGFLDTRGACPDLTDEEQARFVGLLESAKARAQPQADAAHQAWREAREKAGLSAAVSVGEDLAEAKTRIARTLDAALGGSLLGSFPLVLVDEHNKESTVTVDQVLADKARYHLARTLDPLNPDHRDRAADGLLYLNQAVPCVYSLDDGGTVYRLLRQTVRLAVVQGDKARLAEAIADELATEPDLFNVAGQVVQMQGGNFNALSRPLLHYRVGCRVGLYRQGKDKATAVEPDAPLLDIVLALLPSRLKSITGRACTPLVTTACRTITAPGFDDETGLYLDLKPDEAQPISASPTRPELVEALRRAWAPWAAYKWATPHDRAAMLATVLTIPLRPTIDAAPGLFADAASQASGKSKSAGAVAAIVRGRRGGMKTWLADQEEELGKYLLSSVRAGDPAIVLDNITGLMRSASLATVMIEGALNTRLLGVSVLQTPDARLMWLASGNNASLDRDMATRWLVARIDPGVENPSALSFRFDPVEAALQDRIGIARAAITLHLGWYAAGRPKADNIPTRFADWGRVVRPLVQWLHSSGIAADAGIGALGDPAHSILEGSAANDPESEALGMLLQGLNESFGNTPFTAASVRQAYEMQERGIGTDQPLIFEALSALLPQAQRGRLTAHSLACALRNRRGRIVGGLRVVEVHQASTQARRGALWRVENVGP